MAQLYAKDQKTGQFVPVTQYNVQPYNDGDIKNRLNAVETANGNQDTEIAKKANETDLTALANRVSANEQELAGVNVVLDRIIGE